MESKIKSFDQWLEENPLIGRLGLSEDAINNMRFGYDNGVAEAIKYVLKEELKVIEGLPNE